ncbi:hypothetical protein [Aquabacter sp. L1I39]|uniref:hypothetical protein n=1 Tax=Aquabacter sp. L1I39 TaxID=2820278 RepID=UPI001FFCA9B7|nr:hypothetical protein [Aquabacter sp. L1I39]
MAVYGATTEARSRNLDRHRDWPEAVPITEAEIDVFERWFGDLFDDLLGPDT